MDVNLVRDKKTGKTKGFAFVAYEDQRSTILAVDNFNGAKVSPLIVIFSCSFFLNILFLTLNLKFMGRTLRVDHVANYRAPKKDEDEEVDEEVEAMKRKALSLQYEAVEGPLLSFFLSFFFFLNIFNTCPRCTLLDAKRKKNGLPARAEEENEGDEEDPMKDFIADKQRKKEVKRIKKEAKKAKKAEKKTKKESRGEKKRDGERKPQGSDSSSSDSDSAAEERAPKPVAASAPLPEKKTEARRDETRGERRDDRQRSRSRSWERARDRNGRGRRDRSKSRSRSPHRHRDSDRDRDRR